jgi:hypothetical protein
LVAWRVNSPESWEYSFDRGAKHGFGAKVIAFEVLGDGAKTIWVRAFDNMGNTSEIVIVSCVLDTMPPAAVQAAVVTQDQTRLVKVSGLKTKDSGNTPWMTRALGSQALETAWP